MVKQSQAHAIDVLMVSEMISALDLPKRVSEMTDDRVRLIPHLANSIALHEIEPIWSSMILTERQGRISRPIAKMCIYSAPYKAIDLNLPVNPYTVYVDVTDKSASEDWMILFRSYIQGWIDGLCLGR